MDLAVTSTERLRRDRHVLQATNETLWVGWDIVNVDSNSTVDTGSLSWTTTQWHETQNLNTTSLVNVSAGNYSFDVELKWWNTSSSAWETLDSDSDPFVVYTSTGGVTSATNVGVSTTFGTMVRMRTAFDDSILTEHVWAGWDDRGQTGTARCTTLSGPPQVLQADLVNVSSSQYVRQ